MICAAILMAIPHTLGSRICCCFLSSLSQPTHTTVASALFQLSPLLQRLGGPALPRRAPKQKQKQRLRLVQCRSGQAISSGQCKVVTFVGKGGAGKTFNAVIAAKYYASIGLQTCLLVQSQDPTAEFLLGHKLGSFSSALDGGLLTTVRVESTKLLMEPLNQLKKVDAELNFTQGALDEVFGNELGILPGMDPLLSLGVVGQLSDFSNGLVKMAYFSAKKRFDVIVFDGPSSEELLRMFGAAERARWYVKRLRSIIEKTDYGRVFLPSLLRFLEAAFIENSPNGKVIRTTGEIWSAVDDVLKQIVDNIMNPKMFACYLVADVNSSLSTDAALRYWGCAMQAGVHVTGLLHLDSSDGTSMAIKEKFIPLPVARIPYLSFGSAIHWDKVLGKINDPAKEILQGKLPSQKIPPPVAFDQAAQTMSLFLPGFDKSEIKLSQLRGASELLIDTGDQRRIVSLPSEFQRKVSAAKFHEKVLVISFKGQSSL
ncbi:hypothetical protein O6H91_08G110500 [Diphasiastrum complanatum]|uniref:Uncharacterized protein n=1 Tax=Diphasiastrum complanatum TaxID=34168 RepID=A0ACC2D1X0_DIPCM|nr:hypothetical protein O6H91_08G110500 [Diphasiastrum complanatum]